jgi:hypothetical protein
VDELVRRILLGARIAGSGTCAVQVKVDLILHNLRARLPSKVTLASGAFAVHGQWVTEPGPLKATLTREPDREPA